MACVIHTVIFLLMRLVRRSRHFSTSISLFPLSRLMVLSYCAVWLIIQFVSSSDVILLVLLVRSDKVTVPSLTEESCGEEFTFFVALPLPLCEGIFIDEQSLLKPEGNVKKIQLFFR